jgi:hypothetical protein
MTEVWVDIQGYEGRYEVSNTGKVRKLYGNKKELKPELHDKKYYRFSLSLYGIQTHKKTHRLVAEHFIPNPHDKPEINHIDCDKLNNHVSNIEWCTRKENMEHASKEKRLSKEGGAKKLTVIDVKEIRKNPKNFSQYKLAEKYRVTTSNINSVVNRRTWKHI